MARGPKFRDPCCRGSLPFEDNGTGDSGVLVTASLMRIYRMIRIKVQEWEIPTVQPIAVDCGHIHCLGQEVELLK